MAADINFYFDPVCPFAWMTSKWVRLVQAQRGYDVEWRFISLRQINAGVDYEDKFPTGYQAGHTAGLRLLRVAAAAREAQGPEAVGKLYAELGKRIFDSEPLGETVLDSGPYAGSDLRGTPDFVLPALAAAGLPASLVDALDDKNRDAEIQASSDEALSLTGKDVGTPIIHFEPPEGVAFFGPVISRLPDEQAATELWDHVVGLARFPGFAELKRSLREMPRLRGLGIDEDEPGPVDDWRGGSRKQED